MFHLFATYVLTITLNMPMESGVTLNRVSTYTFTGYNSHAKCEQERTQNSHIQPEKGDVLKVGECTKQ